MHIVDLLREGRPSLSFEVFPPKKAENLPSVTEAALQIASLQPSFMSVTYGATGATDRYTADVAQEIQRCGVPALAHLTCVGASRAVTQERLHLLRQRGIQNILALRGDFPEGQPRETGEYAFAQDLVREIVAFGGFCVGAACYPEGHVECERAAQDRLFLKSKVEAGASFLITQMFFDNDILYRFLYQIREIGIQVPVIAGVMPVVNLHQITRICRLSGTWLPARFRAILDRFGDNPSAMRRAGVLYACEQIVDLLSNHVNFIHIYSMNKPEIAQEIHSLLGQILTGS